MSRIKPTPAAGSGEPRRFEELEAYRGIAAVCMILYHVYQHTGALAGGPLYEGTALHTLLSGLRLSGVFFVLSGFLLFLPFARAAVERREPRSARSFLVRRLIRILPLYYLTLLVVWAWRFEGQREQVLDLLLHMSFLHTFHPTYIFWTIGPAWSLAVEMHFYLLLAAFGPLAYRLCGRLPTRGRRLALLGALVGALIGASWLFKAWAAGSPAVAPTDWTVFYSLPARLDALAFGMLLALLVVARRDAALFGAFGARSLQLAGLAMVGAAILLVGRNPDLQPYTATMVSLATAVLIASTALGIRGSGWERALRLPALQFLGAISYGLYLLHEPIMLELGRAGLLSGQGGLAFPVNAVAVMLLTLGAATAASYLLERPCHELRHLFDARGRLVERYAG